MRLSDYCTSSDVGSFAFSGTRLGSAFSIQALIPTNFSMTTTKQQENEL